MLSTSINDFIFNCVRVCCHNMLCDISMLYLCFLYTDVIFTFNCVRVCFHSILCDISMLSLYWPDLYIWLCRGMLSRYALWYLYAVWSLLCVGDFGLSCLSPRTFSCLAAPEQLSGPPDVLLGSDWLSWTEKHIFNFYFHLLSLRSIWKKKKPPMSLFGIITWRLRYFYEIPTF